MIINGCNKDPNEYVILSLAAESERERLLELVTLLNQRLDKERIDTDHLSVSDNELIKNISIVQLIYK